MASVSRAVGWIKMLVPMLVGAGALYLGWLLVTANAQPVKIDFLIGRVELATWQALLLAFAGGAFLVGLYTLYQMTRGGLVRRRYRKQLAGLETEVHQLRNLPLHPGPADEAPFEDDLELASRPARVPAAPGGADRARG